jgi:hypothetical protein
VYPLFYFDFLPAIDLLASTSLMAFDMVSALKKITPAECWSNENVTTGSSAGIMHKYKTNCYE